MYTLWVLQGIINILLASGLYWHLKRHHGA
jgi:hypothetical protein